MEFTEKHWAIVKDSTGKRLGAYKYTVESGVYTIAVGEKQAVSTGSGTISITLEISVTTQQGPFSSTVNYNITFTGTAVA